MSCHAASEELAHKIHLAAKDSSAGASVQNVCDNRQDSDGEYAPLAVLQLAQPQLPSVPAASGKPRAQH